MGGGLSFGFANLRKLISGYQTENDFTLFIVIGLLCALEDKHRQKHTLRTGLIMKNRSSVKHNFGMKPSITQMCNCGAEPHTEWLHSFLKMKLHEGRGRGETQMKKKR